jgi:hypothetical protein
LEGTFGYQHREDVDRETTPPAWTNEESVSFASSVIVVVLACLLVGWLLYLHLRQG